MRFEIIVYGCLTLVFVSLPLTLLVGFMIKWLVSLVKWIVNFAKQDQWNVVIVIACAIIFSEIWIPLLLLYVGFMGVFILLAIFIPMSVFTYPF
jgi:hypothetical protein